MIKYRRPMAGVLACVWIFLAIFSGIVNAEAAKKPVLSSKKLTVWAGKTKKLKVKYAKNAKVSWKVNNKRVVRLKKTSKYVVELKGLKKGNTFVISRIHTGRKKYKLQCKVTVKKKAESFAPKQTNPIISKPSTSLPPTSTPGGGADKSPSGLPSQTPDMSQKPMESMPTALSPLPSAQASPSVQPELSPTPVYTLPAVSTAPPTAAVLSVADFETETDGYAPYGQSKLSIVENGYEGKCLMVSERKQNWNGAGIDLTARLRAGQTYKITAYVKQNSGSAVNVKCMANLDADSSYPKVGNVNVESGVWTKLSGSITIPENFKSCVFYFEVENTMIDFYLDSITIKEQIFIETESIIKTYSNIFPRMGTCVNYNGFREGAKEQLTTAETLNFIKKHFNSISLEDEMKPSSIMNTGWFSTRLTKEEAKARGYILPDDYTEQYVPELNFETLDKVLEIAAKNQLRLRGHTLLWHQQTPTSFFAVNYEGSTPVSPTVMNARMEFYIRTVMEHLIQKEKALTGEAGNIIYTWDVVNEYLHRAKEPTAVSWMDVYGDQGLEPVYVKKAFQLAYDVLKKYGIEKEVSLIYNDYDTYNEVSSILSLIEYINRGESEKICAGIGMQSHMSVTSPTIKRYSDAINAFAEAGLEIQVTELDIGYDAKQSQTEQLQANMYQRIMETLVRAKKNGANITGVTVWGILDIGSWRADSKPLLFAESLGEPKMAFYSFMEASKAWD